MPKVKGMAGGTKKKFRSSRDKANGKYVAQARRTEANRKRKQAKHLRSHPKDKQAA